MRLYVEVGRFHNIRWLALIQFLTNLTFYSTVIVAFQSGRGLTYTEIFWMESILSAAVFLGEVPAGLLADRFGHRRMLILGQVLFVCSYVMFALAHGFWPFALSSVLFGAGLACISGCDTALLYESLPQTDRDRLGTPVFSLMSAASSAGFFCGLVAGSFMGQTDPTLPVYINVLPMALALGASFLLRSGTGPADGHEEPVRVSALIRQTVDLLRLKPGLVALSLFGSAAFALVNAVFWFNQPLFAQAGIAVAWFGPLTAAAVGMGMLAALAAPRAERLLGARGALAFACVAPGLAYLAFGLVGSPLPAGLLVMAVVGGSAWRQPILRSELNRQIPDGARATMLSTLSFLGTLAGIALNPLVGRAGDVGLDFTARFLGMGLVLLGLLVLIPRGLPAQAGSPAAPPAPLP